MRLSILADSYLSDRLHDSAAPAKDKGPGAGNFAALMNHRDSAARLLVLVGLAAMIVACVTASDLARGPTFDADPDLAPLVAATVSVPLQRIRATNQQRSGE